MKGQNLCGNTANNVYKINSVQHLGGAIAIKYSKAIAAVYYTYLSKELANSVQLRHVSQALACAPLQAWYCEITPIQALYKYFYYNS